MVFKLFVGKTAARKRQTRWLDLEQLGERLVPAHVYTWQWTTGAGSGYAWNDATNWTSTDGGTTYPGAGDTAKLTSKVGANKTNWINTDSTAVSYLGTLMINGFSDQ